MTLQPRFLQAKLQQYHKKSEKKWNGKKEKLVKKIWDKRNLKIFILLLFSTISASLGFSSTISSHLVLSWVVETIQESEGNLKNKVRKKMWRRGENIIQYFSFYNFNFLLCGSRPLTRFNATLVFRCIKNIATLHSFQARTFTKEKVSLEKIKYSPQLVKLQLWVLRNHVNS